MLGMCRNPCIAMVCVVLYVQESLCRCRRIMLHSLSVVNFAPVFRLEIIAGEYTKRMCVDLKTYLNGRFPQPMPRHPILHRIIHHWKSKQCTKSKSLKKLPLHHACPYCRNYWKPWPAPCYNCHFKRTNVSRGVTPLMA